MIKQVLLVLILSSCSTPRLNFTRIANTQQTIPGYDALALARYCDTYLQAPKLPAVSTLMNTFGDPLPCLKKALDKNYLTDVQVDLIDATCWRGNKCPPGSPRPTDLKVIKARANKVYQLIKDYEVTTYLSPALEHDIKDANTVKKMLQAAKNGCPTCKVINSPYSGARPTPYPVELHGTKVTSFSVSGDGSSSFDGDNRRFDGNNFQHRISGSYTTFAWWNELNLRCSGEKVFTPPLKRTERPTLDQFKQAYQLMQPEEPIPATPAYCKTIREVSSQKNEIYKTNAESYCNGVVNDKRANKPLLIIRKSGRVGDRMRILSKSGKNIGCFAYYGTYTTPNTYRWYVGNCSGQTAYELFKDLQSEWGFVDLGRNNCLRINSIRRMGTYR